jgi:hypothetical protein
LPMLSLSRLVCPNEHMMMSFWTTSILPTSLLLHYQISPSVH